MAIVPTRDKPNSCFVPSLHLSDVESGGQTVRGRIPARLTADRYRDRSLVFNSRLRKSFPHASAG